MCIPSQERCAYPAVHPSKTIRRPTTRTQSVDGTSAQTRRVQHVCFKTYDI